MEIIRSKGEEYSLPGSLNDFQQELYIHLINWKWERITRRRGVDETSGIEYDAFLPDDYREKFPFLYPEILPAVRELQERFPFRLHLYFNHMASSQAANLNLFLPILLHPNAAEILRAVNPDFARLAVDRLYHGFCVEYWDGVEPERKEGGPADRGQQRGYLDDKTEAAGTDVDIAIAYYNHNEELCLWLIEHKLSESAFTRCGGYQSAKRKGLSGCEQNFGEILSNPGLCYYHNYCHYGYWEITAANPGFYAGHWQFASCPFQGGLNQLWRNQLMGLSIEQDDRMPYQKVHFSVVRHPRNLALDGSIKAYRQLTGNTPKFSVFTSADLLDAAGNLDGWSAWYRRLYAL
jgi:hypothetical protein